MLSPKPLYLVFTRDAPDVISALRDDICKGKMKSFSRYYLLSPFTFVFSGDVIPQRRDNIS
jgi:hypothetical protein